MPGRRRNRNRRRKEEDLWFEAREYRGTRPRFFLQAYWDLTAAKVARYVGGELGVEVNIVMEVDGRPRIVAGNTMVCRPLPYRGSYYSSYGLGAYYSPYTYRVRAA